MNSTTILASLLAFVLLSASVGISNVFATGGLDDEEEEKAIKDLQGDVEEINDSVSEIKEDIDGITLNLNEGENNLTAVCPQQQQQAVQPEPEPEEQGCNPIPEPEPEPPQSVIPEPVINETDDNGCNPVPEEQPEEQSSLEPIYCPINGELLGYLNQTDGELLPISAGNTENNNTFLPPNLGQEPVAEEEDPAQAITQSCNEVPEEEEQPSQAVEDINYDLNCSCFVAQNDNSTSSGQ